MNVSKKILIVDSEPSYRTFVDKALRDAGYSTVSAQNGTEALVGLWENQDIAMVVLDLYLPVINGLNIAEIMRKDFPDKKIIVTGILQDEQQRLAVYDEDDYYDKSQNVSILIEKIDRANGMSGQSLKSDKRNFKRLPVNVLASCDKARSDAYSACAHFFSYTKDLSMYGGRFIVGKDIKVGDHFTMFLELPVNLLPLLIDCEVMWVKKPDGFESKTKGSVEAGIRFLKLDSSRDEERLKNYLNCV